MVNAGVGGVGMADGKVEEEENLLEENTLDWIWRQ